MWEKKINDLIVKKEQVKKGGGESRIEKQHSLGKLSTRERISFLFDENSFVEINDFMCSRINDFGLDKKNIIGDGVLTGYGKINKKLVFVASQDFTVIGGSLGEVHALKICKVMDMALKMRAPFISINDSGGARIEEGIDSLNGYGEIFRRNTMMSGVVPQLSVIMGPCAGGACYSPAISDFIFMTKNTSQMYITGPQVVKTVLSEEVSGHDLGGANIHCSISGVSHFMFDDDISCLEAVKKLLTYLPQNNLEKVSFVRGEQVDECKNLVDIVPVNQRKAYNVKNVINTFSDINSFFEIQEDYAKNIVIGFSRINGETIGIIANQPNFLSGSIDVNASDKASRFIRLCDCFNIPLLSLVDVPAFMPGIDQEHKGIIRHGAKMLYAFAEATVPKICLVMRKAYGGAYIAMNSKSLGADIVYSWPIAEIAVMGAEGAVNIISKKEIESSENKEETRRRLVEEYKDKFMNIEIASKRGFIDEVILPMETKEKIIQALDVLKTKKEERPYKKHGNIPL